MKTETTPYLNREIAWLAFNERVLREAADPTNPIVERMIFLGIFSNNNDEFYRVRVASLKRLLHKKKHRIEYQADPAQLLRRIRAVVNDQLSRFEEIFEANVKELRRQNVYLVDEAHIAAWQARYIKDYFHQHVRRHLYPVFMDKLKDDRGFNDKSNFMAVQMWKSDRPSEKQDMIIEIPVARLTRFLRLPDHRGHHYIILLDDVIRYCLSDILAPLDYDRYSAYTFKFVRDAELDIDFDRHAEVEHDFLAFLSLQLQQRNKSNTVRLVHDAGMPKPLIKRLQKIFAADDDTTFNSRGRYQNKKDFTGFPKDFGEPNLVYPPFLPQDVKAFPVSGSKFEVLRRRDFMLHYPYQSFQHLIDLVREASIDPAVRSIQMAIYRVAPHASNMNAVVKAARTG
ncbi:MAG: hypothetical protein K2L79_06240 [Bacteroidales bacterium]|nr:hypothetical protein [Bacteroidales bacterium]